MKDKIEKELSILRNAVDKVENIKGSKKMQSPEIISILKIVEKFIKKKELICYGGTAINNLIPTEDQFYNKDIELPDYDVFSPTAINDIVSIANLYKKKGYKIKS